MKLTEKQKNCKYCHYPYKRMWMFNNLLYLQIEFDAGEYYLRVMPNDDPEDVGALYDLTDEEKIYTCLKCGRPLNEEEEQ